mmetsp:Transcript_7076/g.21585  ORF Transcript_7076/g.21585 Transcript_7076/m.21585 type:complete len:239 (+) Transcript_7076:2023-2739(+)
MVGWDLEQGGDRFHRRCNRGNLELHQRCNCLGMSVKLHAVAVGLPLDPEVSQRGPEKFGLCGVYGALGKKLEHLQNRDASGLALYAGSDELLIKQDVKKCLLQQLLVTLSSILQACVYLCGRRPDRCLALGNCLELLTKEDLGGSTVGLRRAIQLGIAALLGLWFTFRHRHCRGAQPSRELLRRELSVERPTRRILSLDRAFHAFGTRCSASILQRSRPAQLLAGQLRGQRSNLLQDI